MATECPDWYRVNGEWVYGTTADIARGERVARRTEKELRDQVHDMIGNITVELPTQRFTIRKKPP